MTADLVAVPNIPSAPQLPQEKPSEQTFKGYPETVDLDTKLRIPWPYDEIYRWYLEMKISDANGEMVRYNNAMAKYNAYYTADEHAENDGTVHPSVRRIWGA